MIVADLMPTRKLDLAVGPTFTIAGQVQTDDLGGSVRRLGVADAVAGAQAPLPFEDADFQPPQPDFADGTPTPRVLDYSWQEPLIRQVANWLRVFVEEGQVVELRALNVPLPSGIKVTYSGFYNRDGLEKMAADAVELTADADGVYFTLNPLDDNLLARRFNKVGQAKDTAADADVLKRRWLLVDADPVRKAGISASAEEKRQAWETVRQVYPWLQERGWPDPVLADSGNGYHLLYRVDLPRDDGGVVKSVLEALARRFDGDRVKIDTKVFNPARIVKLYGTVARKGDSLRQRPHRRTGVLAMPADVLPVSRPLVESLAAEVSRPAAATADTPSPGTTLIATDRAALVRRARSYVTKVDPAISGQGGHNQTFKVACILCRFGLTESEALTVLKEWNETCQPPWPEKDLLKKLRDASVRVGRQVTGPAGPADRGTDSAAETAGQRGPALGELLVGDVREAPDDPHRLAQLFLNGTRSGDGAVAVRYWNGDWYRWDGLVYRQVSESEVRAGLTRTIKEEFDRVNLVERIVPVNVADPAPGASTREPLARKVSSRLVTDTLQALKSETFVAGTAELPAWLDGAGTRPAGEMLVASNGLIHLPSFIDGMDAPRPLTPSLFTTTGLDYPVEKDAEPPRAWLDFLEALWPNDAESIGLLQEWFGYCLTSDTSQQKILLVVGPKRAGKGTIARMLTGLVGKSNVAGPTLSSLASNFGLSPLLGKPVAILSDARFSGRSADQAAVVERLLSISGEDLVTIDRKNREHLTVKLPTRFTILTNELPRLTDASAALPSRLLTLQLSRSWYGREDTELTEKLLQERAGVFLWAIEGLKRLRARGRFVQPNSGVETSQRLVELSSPVTAFVQDKCELVPEKSVPKRMLFELWRRWCSESGHEPGSMETFGRNLLAAFPEVQSSRPRDGGTRVTVYRGIGLGRL